MNRISGNKHDDADEKPSHSNVSKINANPKSQEHTKNKRKRKIKPKAGHLQLENKFKRVLRERHYDLSLTRNSKLILNSLVNDIFDRLTDQAIHFQKAAKRKNLTHRDMAAACSILLSGNLQKHAKAAGSKAVIKYLSSYS